jgi:hypothetical protein
MATRKRSRCRSCGDVLPAWRPVAQPPDSAVRLHHLSQHHPDQAGPYLRRMETACIATVVVEAYEVVEGDD